MLTESNRSSLDLGHCQSHVCHIAFSAGHLATTDTTFAVRFSRHATISKLHWMRCFVDFFFSKLGDCCHPTRSLQNRAFHCSNQTKQRIISKEMNCLVNLKQRSFKAGVSVTLEAPLDPNQRCNGSVQKVAHNHCISRYELLRVTVHSP